jgi:DsbC/DsbD-like thiol-disulfide interchange protein
MPLMWILPLLGVLTSTNGPVTWSFASELQKDGRIAVQLTAHVEEGWHLYATELPSDMGPIPTSFRFDPSNAFEVAGPLTEPDAHEEFDPNFSMVVRHHSGAPVFTLPIVRRTSEAFQVEGELEYMVCNDKTCLPPEVVRFSIPIPADK